MKILFAVNNDNISEAVVKKYQNEFKEILSYKNVYYFNAILRELQRDKSYSRIVISEDLEPFANNNYESIDKFLFEKYSNISEEAKSLNGDRIDIILVCADRRKKTDSMLAKIYKKGIYNAIIEQDRSISEICRLIYSPRDKDEAKRYYSIQESELGDSEGEDTVSEAEIENIRAHYARLGRNEDKFIESFNNIVSQYSDTQLRIIIKYLPMNVKAVLEERSPKYQQLVTTSSMEGIDLRKKADNYKERIKNKPEVEDSNDEVLNQLMKKNSIKSVVIPESMTTANVQRVTIPKVEKPDIQIKRAETFMPHINKNEDMVQTTRSKDEIRQELLDRTEKNEDLTDFNEDLPDISDMMEDNTEETVEISEMTKNTIEESQGIQENVQSKQEETELITEEKENEQLLENNSVNQAEQPRRGRGRPRKYMPSELIDNKPKRGRGRPKKQPVEQPDELLTEVFNQNDEIQNNIIDEHDEIKTENSMETMQNSENSDISLFDLNEPENNEEEKEDTSLYNLENVAENSEVSEGKDDTNEAFSVEEMNTIEKSEPKEDVSLFEIEDDIDNEDKNSETNPTQLNEINEVEEEEDLFSLEEQNEEEDVDLFNMDEPTIGKNDYSDYSNEQNMPDFNQNNHRGHNTNLTKIGNISQSYSALLTGNRKIVAFVGTTKNGTSFIVNNTAEMLSEMGINTAILDMTKSKNSYYIYTNDEEKLRNIAKNCMLNLERGIAQGIKPNKQLSIYTEMPGEEKNVDIETILTTLLNNHTVVLVDTDFDTSPELFERVQEIYLVQSMDVLTIQPLTAFLRNLKSKGVLKADRLRVVINKAERVRSLNAKVLIGGMANYNSPSMTYMTELFNKDTIKYCEIPFEVQNYVKYLESLVICSITLNGYTKVFLDALKELANMVYPLVNRQGYSSISSNDRDPFSSHVNETLSKMKKNY